MYGTVTERTDAGRPTRICGTYQNITAQKRSQEQLNILTAQLEHRATYDSLTDVFNRGAIMQRLEEELVRADREETGLTVALLDVDKFKDINDNHGHPVGDQVLVALVDRIQKVLRVYDHVGRYGGEEFLIIAPARDGVEDLHDRIRNAIAHPPIETQAGTLRVTASIGVATYYPGAKSLEELLSAADEALYRAKKLGRNEVVRDL